MKSIFRTLAGIAMAFGLFACTEEKIEPAGQEGILGDAETYVSLRVVMPGGSLGLKSDPENGDAVEQGQGAENTFENVSLYFFAKGTDRAVGGCLGTLYLESNIFKEIPTGGNVYWQTQTAHKVGLEGDFYVYAVLNGKVDGVSVGTDVTTFIQSAIDVSAAIKLDNQKELKTLVMTSRQPGSVSLSSNAGAPGSSKDKPAELNLNVERMAAKISYKAVNANNEYTIETDATTAEQSVTARLTGYKIVNQRNNAYSFRKVGDNLDDALAQSHYGGNDLALGKYVIDPVFGDKTKELADKPDEFKAWFGENYLPNPADKAGYQSLPTAPEYTLMTYCMENTMKKDAQLNGYSTGVIFKAFYTPNKVSKLKTDKTDWETVAFADITPVAGAEEQFYLYDNKLWYASEDDMREMHHISADYNELIPYEYNADAKALVCYYKYWLKHLPTEVEGDLEVMEFAIVRNNAYRLDVKSISGIGEPGDTIDPENPDEDQELYLDVNVEIMPWVVRNNSIEL